MKIIVYRDAGTWRIEGHSRLIRTLARLEGVTTVKAQLILDAYLAKVVDPKEFGRSETYRRVLSECKLETLALLECITEYRDFCGY
ncbi:hypothetical protein B6U99_00900 [Candidatus Geothermarchaeota archaeon ex4572_27]|nr:MAG: hypothetical protein B6U99_00900 [Candidatus Geothermarchaeota archaeon ex4572_27]